jgi:hypothetical protein
MLSAVDVANMQRLAALLNEYVREMGVDPRVVTIASGITPWGPIYILSKAEVESLNLDNSSAPSDEGSADWRVQPTGNGAMAVTTQTQDGAGRVASLGIMCLQSTRKSVLVQLAVRDDTKDWAQVFKMKPSPQSFEFELDGKDTELNAERLVSPVTRSGNGAVLTFAITMDELRRMMNARSIDLNGFTDMATQSWSGELGGRFSMAGSPAVIGLALRNCVSR